MIHELNLQTPQDAVSVNNGSVCSYKHSFIQYHSMSQKEKLSFKYPKIRKQSEVIESKHASVENKNQVYSEKFMLNLDSLCERIEARLETSIKVQNGKIEALETKYFDALLGRFDKLISVNQKIGRNLERLVQRFQVEEKPPRSEYFLPPISNEFKAGNVGFKALSTRRLTKSKGNETPRKVQSLSSEFKPKKKQEQRKDGQQENALETYQEEKPGQTNQIATKTTNNPKSSRSDKYLKEAFDQIIQSHCQEELISVSLNKFIGQFYFKKAEFYYLEYTAGRMRHDDFKIRFSTDIINEAIELSKQWMDYVLSKNCQNLLDTCVIKGKDFFRLFNEASKNSLEYLIHKYPPSRTKQVDTELSERIKETKSFSMVKYDLLKNAGVYFGEKKGQTDFSTEIKQWLNKLILETKKEYPSFKQKMKDIFTNNEGSLDGSKIDNEVEYSIGSKLPENAVLYSQEEIELPGLPIKNPEVLRILIKWYEELMSYFTNAQQKIIGNKFGFKSNKFKNVPVRMPHSKVVKLAEKLQNIYQSKVKPFKKNIYRDLGELLEGLIATSMVGVEGYDFLDEREVTITKLASILYETFKEYILIFLNGLMSFFVDVKNEYDNSSSESVINLISFTLMDILRCKCVGTKKQIYRIYNQILDKKDYFEVIRVKNKLNEPTRDILINLKLKNSFLVCEVQLSLGSNQQQTNDHFCHYLYQLERSQLGTLFECASQIANLDPKISYIKKHPDMTFKKNSRVSEILKTKIKIRQGEFYCNISHEQTKMEMVPNTTPFCCIYCNSFIESNRLRLPYFKCMRCAVCICTQCVGYLTQVDPSIMAIIFQNTDCIKRCIPQEFYKGDFLYNGAYQQSKIQKELKKVLSVNQYAVLCVVTKAGCHQIVYKKYRESVTQAFSTIPQMSSTIDHKERTSLSCIVTLQEAVRMKIKDLEGYMKYHIEMDWYQLDEILQKHKIQEVICIVEENIKSILIVDIVETEEMIDNIRLERSLCRQVRRLNKHKDTYLEITSKKIQSLDFLRAVENKKSITTMNLWENKIDNIDILSEFSNLEELYLQENSITQIKPLLDLSKIQMLGLSENNITGSLPRLAMPNLQFLILSNNKLSDVNNLSLSTLPNLTFIKLYKNPLLVEFPVIDFPKLEVILLNDCMIRNVFQLSKSKLPNLTNLQLSHNQIEGALTDFNFPSLTNLQICQNKISSLKDFIYSRLPKLKTLDLRFNQISDSIYDLNLPQLRELLLAHNRITHIGEQILYCKKLPQITTIDLRYNNIAGKLPRFKLSTLKKFDFGFNKLSDISQLEESYFHSIQEIKLDHNQIECHLPSISFKTLKTIDLSYNQISNVCSLSKWRGQSLEDIKLNNNKINGDIPPVEMYSLKYLDFGNNEIHTENLLANIHLIPEIVRINFSSNTPLLDQAVRGKYEQNKSLEKTVEI